MKLTPLVVVVSSAVTLAQRPSLAAVNAVDNEPMFAVLAVTLALRPVPAVYMSFDIAVTLALRPVLAFEIASDIPVI